MEFKFILPVNLHRSVLDTRYSYRQYRRVPKKNTLKTYKENTFYHLYNRGVDNRNIFTNKKDYLTFLSTLERYLSPPPEDSSSLKEKSLCEEIDLLAYTLMPDHFHLLVKQAKKDSITRFMRKIGTSYSMYFNKKYKRSGTLFEGRYKAVIVDTDEKLLDLSLYIHLNSHLAGIYTFKAYPYSSYHAFTNKESPPWLKPDHIIAYFNKTNKKLTYEQYVIEHLNKELFFDKNLVLEEV